jgi:hypothetical protein
MSSFRRNTILTTPLPDRLGWIRLSHVCRHWRDVALAYPSLWDHIPFSLGERWSRTALERAKSSELVIRHLLYVGTPGYQLLTRSDFLSELLDRVSVLELGGAPDALNLALSHLRKPAPRLQVLAIQADRPTGANEGWPFSLPRGLFQHETPALRELNLDNCFPSMIPPNLYILRHLSICLRQPKREFARSQNVFSLLRGMVNLETLVLKHCLPQESDDITESLDLPSLKSIDLVDSHGSISQFLRVVSFPKTVSVEIQSSMSSGPDESSGALSLITPCASHVQQPRFLSFVASGRGLQMTLSSRSNPDRPELYVFIMHSGSGDWDYPRVLRETSAAISSPHVVGSVELCFPEFSAHRNALPDLCIETLSRFEHAHTVRVSRTLGWAMCSALSMRTPAGLSALFPRLETITLASVDFYEPFLNPVLIAVVRARRNLLKKVRLIGCQYRGELVPELLTMVEVEVLEEEVEHVVTII